MTIQETRTTIQKQKFEEIIDEIIVHNKEHTTVLESICIIVELNITAFTNTLTITTINQDQLS